MTMSAAKLLTLTLFPLEYWYGVWISHTIDGCGCPRAWHTYDEVSFIRGNCGDDLQSFILILTIYSIHCG